MGVEVQSTNWKISGSILSVYTPDGLLQFNIGGFEDKTITSVKLLYDGGGNHRLVVEWDGPSVPPQPVHLKDILVDGAEKFLGETLATPSGPTVSGYLLKKQMEFAEYQQDELAKAKLAKEMYNHGFLSSKTAHELIDGFTDQVKSPFEKEMDGYFWAHLEQEAAMKNLPTQQDIATCNKCSLAGAAGVPGKLVGETCPYLMVVGEAPGAMEDHAGEPFVGQSGKLLRSWLKEAGFLSYYLTNVVKHRPPGNATPSPKQMKACSHWLKQEFLAVRPRVVLAVGKTACHALDMKGPMKKMHGMSTVYKPDPQLWLKPFTLIGMYHPAYVLRQGMDEKLVNACMSVLYQAKEMAGNPPQSKESPSEPSQGWCIPASTSTLTKHFAVDVETDSLDPRTCQSVVWSWAMVGNWAGYAPKKSVYTKDVHLGDNPLILHHACFDLPILMRKQGATWTGTEVHDTMLMAKHAGYDDLSLKGLYSKIFKKPAQTFEQMAAGRDIKDIPEEEVGAYCQHDSEMTADLFDYIWHNHPLPAAYHNIDRPLIPILARMTLEGGFELDKVRLKEYGWTLTQEINHWTGTAYVLAGHEFNVKSRDQVADVLHGELHLPILSGLTKAKGRPIVDDAALAKLANLHALPRVLRVINRKQKEMSAFVLPWLETKGSRLSSIYEFGADTGRLSCHGPNLQQVPDHLRKFLYAPDGHYLISLDYSQIEFRVAAHLSGDPVMRAFFDKPNADIHESTGAFLDIPRKVAKTCNFALLYGGGPGTIVEQAGVTWQAAHTMHAKMRETYPVFYAWAQHQANACKHSPLEGLYGRKHYIPDGPDDLMARQAVNRPIQGGAVDICKAAMVRMEAWIHGMGARFAAQIHDEIILVMPNFHEDNLGIMETLKEMCLTDNPLSVPIDITVKTGECWGKMEEWTAP